MGHGTIEIEEERDHTAARLADKIEAAQFLAGHAHKSVEEAEINLSLAKLAADRADENVAAARKAYRVHIEKRRA